MLQNQGVLFRLALLLVCQTICGHALLAQEPVPLTEPKMPGSQLGQEKGTLAVLGTVLDPAGAAVPGVRVVVTNLATGSSRETTTNSSGQFAVSNLPSGRYRVRATVEGFKEMEKEIELSPSGINALTFTMPFGEPVPRAEPKPGITSRDQHPSGGTPKNPYPPEAPKPDGVEKPNKEPDTASTTTVVVRATLPDEVEVQKWLDRQAAEHKQLLAMISLRPKSSLAVLKVVPSQAKIECLAIPVNHALEPSDLERRIKLQSSLRFLGIHRLTSSSYVMVSCRE